jgi:dTDP-glucose 4,6-dehydratase
MKKMLVTGGTGFIGHYLVQEFINDYELICLVRPGSKNLTRLEEYLDKIKIIEHDIKYPLDSIVDQLLDVEVILHAGGNPSAADSLNDPIMSVNDNVLGTAHLLELSRKLNLTRFVYYSSSEVFGPVPIGVDSNENDAYNSNSPYAATKAAGEELCVAYSKSFNIPVSIFHINNTFGLKSQSNRLPVIIIKKVLNDEELDIHVGNNVIGGRRWFYAGDVASHTRFVLENQTQSCNKWNSAGASFINNLDLALLISNIIGKELKYKLIPVDRPGHDLCFSINPKKLYDLGWKEPKPFLTRLEETVQWYLKNQHWL